MHFSELFEVFLWKNWRSLRSNWLSLSVISIGCAIILGIFLNSTKELKTTPFTKYEGKDTDTLRSYFPANEQDLLYYGPSSPKIYALMEEVRRDFQISSETWHAFENITGMHSALEHDCTGHCFAVEFEQSSRGNFPNGDKLIYTISGTSMRLSPNKHYVNDEEVYDATEDDEYLRTGFLALQHMIDRHYINMSAGNDYTLNIAVMPSIAQESRGSQRIIWFGFVFSTLFCALLLSTFIVPLVEEKQAGLKEFLVIATPWNFLNGVTFFLVRFCLYLIYLTVILLTAYFLKQLGIAPFAYIFALFVLYVLSAMSYAYLISVCFNSVFYAKIGGLVLLIMPYVFFLVKGSIAAAATYLFSTKSFMDGLEIFQIFSNKKYAEFTLHDFTVHITESSFSMLSIYGCLIFQCILYSALYNYLSAVFPGPGGLKKPYNYLFKKSFWHKKQRNDYTTGEKGTDAIIIQDLVKRFKKPERVIADNLNMIIKNKQITVLLGHNGAGKTTTLNMIMGSEPKDSGKITVCSERDVASYRHLIGFCPQHSVFMNYMTCAEHLEFFARLRGMSKKEAKTLSSTLLKQLKLEDKAKEYGKNLSGGMKRRLSLGIAICGDTKIVILDEPSSGLDIESRRELWDILLELRKRKALLVTTHHMEEAEILGDTIHILGNGRLQCSGTPLQLKRRYGKGYILKLCMQNGDYIVTETLQLIQKQMASAAVLNVVPPTVLVSLPYSDKSKYSVMLKELESNQTKFGIKSISIADTSLEDVFLNCAAEIDQVDSPGVKSQTDASRIPYQPLNKTAQISIWQQFQAVWYKKFIYLRSEWLYTLIALCLPFFYMLSVIAYIYSMSLVENNEVLPLNLQHIKEGVIYIHNPFDNATNARTVSLLTKQIQQHGIKVKRLGDDNTLTEAMIKMQEKNLADFLQSVIGIIELSNEGDDYYTLYFSGNIYHSSVIMLNLLENTILKLKTNEGASIETKYKPIRRFILVASSTRLEYYAGILPIGLFFYMFFYVVLPYREHITGFKNLQPVPSFTYWSSVLTFDLALHLLVCGLLFVFQMLIMPRVLYSTDEQLTIILSIFFYGFSYLPILYSFATCFRSISTITTYLLFMLVISAIVPLITSNSIQAMLNNEMEITLLSILLPDFNLNHQLRVINENFLKNQRSSQTTFIAGNGKNTQGAVSAGYFFAYAIFLFVVAGFIFINVLEKKEIREKLSNLVNCECRTISTNSVDSEEEETFLKDEKTTVDEILADTEKMKEYPLLVSKLYKNYKQQRAVCDLNFAVKAQECFGLLGVNGAGKTSTFQMITANNTITRGTIKIDGIDILKQEKEYKYCFGYCPQNDCLNSFMTAQEILTYMARLRGLQKADIDDEVSYWLRELDLEKYRNVKIGNYSGGTKRKLNAAIAMIGSPSLVLLDEPTTGVDPASRRFLWKCIQDFQKRGKTVVLTSHSMDECEQLCNRLAIMANEKFRCIGYVPDLKQRYGNCFTIKVKLREHSSNDETANEMTKELRKLFIDCDLRENHAGTLTYFIKNLQDNLWSNVFEALEYASSNQSIWNEEVIEDYSVNESTLEDIFLKFDNSKRRQASTPQVTDGRLPI